jgi:hypothetical protein
LVFTSEILPLPVSLQPSGDLPCSCPRQKNAATIYLEPEAPGSFSPLRLIPLNLMRSLSALVVLTGLIAVIGCHSPYVEATVSNRTGQPIELIEVDYPTASFGTENLADGSDFHYRFKVLGSGKTKLLYTDNAHKDHKADGPALTEGAEGSLKITITPTGVAWRPDLKVKISR